MMDWFRLLIALLLMTLGIYLIADLWLSGFDLLVLLAALASFVLAHYIKPDNNSYDRSSIYDIVDLIIDLPFRAIALAIRGTSKPFKGDIDGIDI